MKSAENESIMIPRPPIWIRTSMIIFPHKLNADAVSTTINPVTQTAEVEVK